jgi:hypothetical protein
MALKFENCKRRFDVTVKIQTYDKHDWQTEYEGSMCVWSYSPSLRQLTDPILDETKLNKSGARISILYIREHEFSEYTPAQMGKMMAQEGYTFSDNPYVDTDHSQADTWIESFTKEIAFLKKRG